MALILNIETATKNCSVSIAENGKVIALEELNSANYSHAEKLHFFIEKVLQKAKINGIQLDAIAVSKGPGSYTGLRIGVSAAKGLCFALDKPLISIETLAALSHTISVDKGFIIPMLDARRMEVYSAVFNRHYEAVRGIKAEVINPYSFQEYLEKDSVTFLGDGAEKCKAVLTHKNAQFIDNQFPSSKQIADISYKKYEGNEFEDVAYFEPFYLKDFIAVPEKKRKNSFSNF